MVDLRCTLEEIEIDNGGECEYQELGNDEE